MKTLCIPHRLASFALVAVLGTTVAGAATISVSLGGTACGSAGICTSNAAATEISFDGLDGQTLPQNLGGATYTGGAGSPFVSGSSSSNFAAPNGDSTTYLTVGSPSRPEPVTIDFLSPIGYFGFYMGSPDLYNLITFYSQGVQVAQFNGGQLINPADGAWTTGEYVNFTVQGGSVDQIVMNSSQAAFETDNHAFASAVPEPMSLSLTGGALLAMAGIMRRRRK